MHETALSKEALRSYFIEGCKKPGDLKVGVEWEKIGVYKDTARAIAYSGPRGVTAIFKELVKKYGWGPVFLGPHIVALRKGESSITLEPGGQIELSGRKALTLDENAAELLTHLKEIEAVSEPLGIAWLGIGLQPFSTVDEIEWVPKERYAIMREVLKNKGALTYCMMKQTASIQISLDYTSEADAAEKLRLAMGLAPIFSALFANSPIWEGRLNGFYSKRADIWLHTAPERTGIIPAVFRDGFGFDGYMEYALGVPMLFIVRQGKWIPMNGMTFNDFLKKGLAYYRATPADWDLHLTTIFTEARLKKYLEVRSMDCQQAELGLAIPALLKGLFYNDVARKKAWGLVADLSAEERKKLAASVPREGLKTQFKGKTLLEPALQLLKLAEEGLKGNEAKYLTPLKKLLGERGMTPAEALLKCLEKNATQKELAQRVLTCAAI